jgi:hypothetical protein
VKLHETLVYEESVATQLITVVPTGNLEPDGGSQTVVTQFPVVVGAG